MRLVNGQSLNSRLLQSLEGVLLSVFGEPTTQNENEWRYGNKGSLSIDVGPKRGAWYDFERNEGSGIHALLARTWELDPVFDKTTVDAKAEELLEKVPPSHNSDCSVVEDSNKWDPDEAVRLFWEEAGPLSEQHGKAYLRSRAINPEIDAANIRQVSHRANKEAKSYPALVFPLKHENDEVVAVQAIRCPRGQKLNNAAKITNGNLKGAAIKLPGRKTDNGEIIIVEGPEDALSIWQKTGLETWATCSIGNLCNVPLRLSDRIVVIGDADKSTEDKTRSACRELAVRCASVRLVFPTDGQKDPNAILMNAPNKAPEIFHAMIDAAEFVKNDSNSSKPLRRLITMEEMMSDFGGVNWLIEGVLEQEVFGVLYGAPKTGKTFVALDMSLSIASGKNYHGKPTTQSAVVYVAGEGVSGLRRRTKAWCIEHGVDANSLPVLWSWRGQPLTDAEEARALSQEITQLAEQHDVPVSLIVIDTLNRNFGGADENSTKDMTAFVANLDLLRTDHNATILVVHHSGLSTDKRSRGSSVLYGAVDANMQVSTRRDAVVLNVEVLKDADSPPPLIFSNHSIEFPTTDGETASSLVLRSSDVPASLIVREDFFSKHSALRGQNGRDKLEHRLPGMLEAMHGGQRNWKALAQSYGGKSKDTFDGYIKRLRTEGLVAADSYELTEDGKEAARILVPSIGIEAVIEDSDLSFRAARFKPDTKPNKPPRTVRLDEPDSTRTSP